MGGFRLGLEGKDSVGLPGSGWRVVWSNQWEPNSRRQHASDVYVGQFGPSGHVNDDIAHVLTQAEAGETSIPDVDLVVGGFPCQDYSVAKPLPLASGLEGKKGVLWWAIERFLRLKRPRFVLLENVDRLLKSPARQRGRDLAIILACLADLGYWAEWRVINAAEYGFPQRRRRVFLLAYRDLPPADPIRWIFKDGVLARAFPVQEPEAPTLALFQDKPNLTLVGELHEISERFGSSSQSPFARSGAMIKNDVWTNDIHPQYDGPVHTLGSILQDESDVASEFFINDAELAKWHYLKGAKAEPRTHKNGHRYFYQEGAVAFPDAANQPSRTLLTGEGGRTPSRFKHVIATQSGRYRRLTPLELERLNGFPDEWTAGIPDGRRAFLMGNALIVGVVQLIGKSLKAHAKRERF